MNPNETLGEASPKPESSQDLKMSERIARRIGDGKTGRPPKVESSVPPADEKQGSREAPKLRELDAEIEQELQAVIAGMDDASLNPEPVKAAALGDKPPAAGQKRGTVIRIHGSDVFIDLPGGRSQGMLPMIQFDKPPQIGDYVDVHVERYDPANGLLLLSRQGATVQADWSSVAIGQVVEARVTAVNKGGLAVEVNGIRAFMPMSQIELFRVENAEQYLNQKILCMVAEVQPAERNLVVSRRALLEREREELAKKLWEELKEGQIRTGTVKLVRPFGAFVDLGGVDGLVPASEISWQRVNDPSEFLKPGQQLEVLVTRIDREARKVSLSLKQTLASPWDDIHARFPEKSIVNGTVTRIAEFGAFVELEPGIEGLIHISEAARGRVRRIQDVVQIGQTISVKVLTIDKAQRRIGLSLKATEPEPEPEVIEPEASEPEKPVKPERPRTTPLRGGTGSGGPLFPDLKSH